jgi:hypothetical protein
MRPPHTKPLHRRSLLVLVAVLAACGGETGDDGGGDGGGNDGGNGADDAGAPDPAWVRGTSESPVAMDCTRTRSELEVSGAPAVAVDDTVIFAGYEQVSGNNQDPLVVRFDGDAQTWCEHHEQTPPDGRAVGLTWDGGDTLYVVYTVDGGGSGFDAHVDGWQDSYGMGGGPKVSVLLAVDAEDGSPTHGTYVISKLSNGNTNTHGPREAPFVESDGSVGFRGESAFQPLNPDKTTMTCTEYPFDTFARFSADLSTVLCAESTNCLASTPCEG